MCVGDGVELWGCQEGHGTRGMGLWWNQTTENTLYEPHLAPRQSVLKDQVPASPCPPPRPGSG